MNAIPWWVWVVIFLFVVLPIMGFGFWYVMCRMSAWADEQTARQFYEMVERQQEQEAIPFYVEEVEYDNEYRNAVV